MTNLLTGDNLLAVEVHNYNAGSPDITFGLSAAYTVPSRPSPTLAILFTNGVAVLSWEASGFTLQQADTPAGSWADIPGPVITSPFILTNSDSARYFRLRR